jgi:hypothetical protein
MIQKIYKILLLVLLQFACLNTVKGQELSIYKDRYKSSVYVINFSDKKKCLFLMPLVDININKNELKTFYEDDSTFKIEVDKYILSGLILSDSMLFNSNYWLSNKNVLFYNKSISNLSDSILTLFKIRNTFNIDTIVFNDEKFFLHKNSSRINLGKIGGKQIVENNKIAMIKYLECKELDFDVCFEYLNDWHTSMSIGFKIFAIKDYRIIAIKRELDSEWYKFTRSIISVGNGGNVSNGTFDKK